MRFSAIRNAEDMELVVSNEPTSVVASTSRLGAKEGTKRFRNSGPKSRTGCITCKIRRVKCGEEKPACTRCSSTGRKCDGYITPPHPSNHSKTKSKEMTLQEKALAPEVSSRTRPDLAVPRNPSVDIEGSIPERRSFHYFRSRNMSAMPGNFEPYFWDHLVLQFSHRDPTIRYSLVALSAIYEAHDRNPGSKLQSVYVLEQYTKALRHLADSLMKGQADQRVTLISCLIFIWIELLQNNYESGFKHLESGLRILSDLGKGAESGKRWGSTDFDDVFGSLDRSFKRLSIQAMMHGGFSSSLDLGLETNPWATVQAVHSVFETLFEARGFLDGMMNFVAVYLRQIRDSEEYGTADQVPDLLLVDSVCESSLARLAEWHQALPRVLTMRSGDLEKAHPFPARTYLELYHTYLYVILRTPFAVSEMVFDGYTTEFASIVELASHLLDESGHEGSVLSFDMGIIPPLFFLVLKCRDINLRRRALALLKRAPEQEGLWRQAGVVAYSEWKIGYEESGRGELPESSPLPEKARIYQERVSFGMRDGRRVPLLVFRRSSVSLNEPPEEVEISEETQAAIGMGNMV